MNQAIIQVLLLVVSCFVGIFVATEIADGNYPLAAGALTCLVVPLLWLGFARKVPFESVLLGALVIGYYVLGKGLSYLRFTSILFIGEVVLGFVMLSYLFSVQSGRFRLIPKSELAIPLICLGCYSILHLFVDFRRFGIMALRDSCMIYYTLFFFVSYQLASIKGVLEKLSKAMLLAAPLVIFSDIAVSFSDVFTKTLQKFTIRNVPIYYPHNDASLKGIVAFWLFLFSTASLNKGRWKILAATGCCFLSIYLLVIGRGAVYVTMAALAIFVFLCSNARQKIALTFYGIVAITMGSMLAYSGLLGSKRFDQIADQVKALNIFSLANQNSTDAATAEWRLFWWRKIAKDVWQRNFLFGLGFGEDIGGDFAEAYFKISVASEEHSRTRGAHNGFFTTLARLGWVGAMLFLWVAFIQLKYFARCIVAYRIGKVPPYVMYYWGAVIAGFVVTYFQYTWEASYAAIPYWVCCGLAYAHLDNNFVIHKNQLSNVNSTLGRDSSLHHENMGGNFAR